MSVNAVDAPLARPSRAAADIFRVAFERAPIPMALVDAAGRWFRVNAALCSLLGYDEEELLRLTAAEVTAPGVPPVGLETVAGSRAETCFLREDGDAVWVSVRAAALEDGTFVAQVGNITERKRAERGLRRLADHDALTWLPNRRCFLEGLRTQLRRIKLDGDYGALLLLDLDGFKQVNDTAGHEAGDKVLQATADVLRRRLRSSDLLGRLGGDEFAALVLDVTPREAREVASQLAEGLRAHVVTYGTRDLHIDASIGVVDIDERTGDNEDELLVAADRAMYRVKTSRRGG